MKCFPSMFTNVLDTQILYNHASYILSDFIGEKTVIQTSSPISHSQEAVKSHFDSSLPDTQAIHLPP